MHLPFSQTLKVPHGVRPSTKGENTLIQRKPLWLNLLTFCFVINTYRCLCVNRMLGKTAASKPAELIQENAVRVLHYVEDNILIL